MNRTPLYEEHIALNARMVDFNGWEMPLHYDPGILEEHLATRRAAGLFDVSHMGRFLITGRDALAFLQYTLTNNAAALEPERAQYTLIPNENGGAVDDAYLYRLTKDEYLLVVNAANTKKDWDWLQKYILRFPDVRMEDKTAEIAMLAFQGPESRSVLEAMLDQGSQLPDPARNCLRKARIGGVEVYISRTGYTGEPLCFELFIPREAAREIWRRILELGRGKGILPVGLGARDTLRLEAGLPLYGHELGTDPEGKEIPIFALTQGRMAVSFSREKGDFVGKRALAEQLEELKQREAGTLRKPKEKQLVPRRIYPIAVMGQGICRRGDEVRVGNIKVGYVTSGTMTAYCKFEGKGVMSRITCEVEKRALGLALLDADIRDGQVIHIRTKTRVIDARVVKRNLGAEAPPHSRPILFEEVERKKVSEERELFSVRARELVQRAAENTRWRRTQCINLIPSEQTPSALVRALTIMDPEGRYAEHRLVKALGNVEVYYYQGTKFITWVEEAFLEEMRKFLSCSEVEARVISGQMANAAVFSGIVDWLNRVDRKSEPKRIRKVMNHHIGRGGHLSSQPMGALRDYVAHDPMSDRHAVVNFPVQKENPYKIDLEETARLMEEHRPQLIILGKSMVLHPEPVVKMRRLADRLPERPLLMYDMAHVLGLVGPYFQMPFQEGADIVTGSTHKTFFGTQRGIISSNMSPGTQYEELWEAIQRRVFPGSVSNHHLGTLLGNLMAAYELNTYGREYQKQILDNSKAFARALHDHGVQVEGDPSVGYTETHQVLIRVGYARGVEIAHKLEKSNIIANYQALPDDEGFTSASGIRMGVQEMTRFGMREADFEELASLVADVVLRGTDVGEKARALRGKFLEMKFCLPESEAAPLLEELMAEFR
ncbi:MAG: glycine cleavage system aminomethyltransferase GcvT [Thermoplasmata archaeon]